MFNKDSDYALNKHSQNIVYRQADGSCLAVRPEARKFSFAAEAKRAKNQGFVGAQSSNRA